MFAAGLTLFLIAYSNLTVTFVPELYSALLNVVTGVALTWWARSEGFSWSDLGVEASPLLIAVWVALAGVAFLIAFLVGRRTDRYRGMPRRELLARALFRIPIATALFEEIAFRGVLYATLAAVGSDLAAVGLSSGVFALWHLAGEIKRQGEREPAPPPMRALSKAWVGVLGTGVLGLGLGWLRACSGSILPSTLLHAAVNSGGMVGSATGVEPPTGA